MRNARLLAALLLVTACISCGDGSSGGTGGSTGGSAKGGAGGSGTAGTSGGTAGANGGRGGTSAGAAGTGGSAAGTAGSAGTVGSAGTNGTAGTGGTTGAAGNAGTGGRGGTGGSAGSGGGTAGSGGATAGAGGRGGGGGSAGGTGGRGGTGGSVGGAGGRGGAAGTGGVAGGAGRGGATAGTGGTSVTDGGTDGTAAFNPCPTTAGTACIIMPLGDSITDGVGSSGGGYRVPLFQTSITNMDLITFVGRNANGPQMVGGRTFPRNHEGYSGYTIDPGGGRSGISPLVDGAISMFHPHIVLLMIGTNDVNISLDLANAPTRLGALLDRITTDAPNALLVVARLTPTTNDTTNGRVQTYNNAIPGLVNTRATAGKHIVLVDMYAAFTANANYKTALMNDELHPNDAGYAVMATTWNAAIRNFLPSN